MELICSVSLIVKTIGILEDEDDDDSSNSEFRLNITSAIRLASEGGKTKAGAFAYAPCESSGGAPNGAIPASDLVHWGSGRGRGARIVQLMPIYSSDKA